MNNNLFHWSDSTWLLVDQIGILLGLVLAVATPLAGLIAFLKRDSVRRWLLRRPLLATQLAENDIAGQYDGILFTVSNADLPLEIIKTAKPTAIALLGTLHSSDALETIAKSARNSGIAVYQETLANPDDVPEAAAKAEKLLQKMQEKHKHLAVDITGGKLPMSLGAYHAAEKQGIPVLYATSKYNQQLKKIEPGSTRITQIA